METGGHVVCQRTPRFAEERRLLSRRCCRALQYERNCQREPPVDREFLARRAKTGTSRGGPGRFRSLPRERLGGRRSRPRCAGDSLVLRRLPSLIPVNVLLNKRACRWAATAVQYRGRFRSYQIESV